MKPNKIESKLINVDELMQYLRVGKNNARVIGEQAGAVVRVGKRVLYNRAAIDSYVEGRAQLLGNEVR